MEPQVNDEGAVPVGVPGPLVLLPLAVLQLLLYAAHATRNRPKFADPKMSRSHFSLLLS